VEDQKEVLGNVLATDVDFGPDGAIYVSDWVQGWNGTGKGRIYKFFDPASRDSAPVKQVAALLAAGFASRPTAELRSLLAHADRRIRRDAQFALADRKDVAGLTEIARGAASRLARLHALWGLGQIARRGDTAAVGGVDGLLDDDDAEVRAQTARLLGDCGIASATAGLITKLGDASPRVRAFAAMGLGKLAAREALPAVVRMLAADAGADPILRHAGIMALAGAGERPLGSLSPLSADERAALVDALESGHLDSAALDVTPEEPPKPESRLWTAPRLLITPHVGGQAKHRIDAMTDFFCDNLRRYRAGRPLRNLVDKRLGFPEPPDEELPS
jgi:quinoprotein glucose dehydrogenase